MSCDTRQRRGLEGEVRRQEGDGRVHGTTGGVDVRARAYAPGHEATGMETNDTAYNGLVDDARDR